MTFHFWFSSDLGKKIGRRIRLDDLYFVLFLVFHLILGKKLHVERRDELYFGFHLIWGEKLYVSLSVSRVRLRQPRSC